MSDKRDWPTEHPTDCPCVMCDPCQVRQEQQERDARKAAEGEAMSDRESLGDWGREADLACSILVAEIGRTTVWTDVYRTAIVIAHVRRLEEEHQREMIHLHGPRQDRVAFRGGSRGGKP